MLNGIRVLMALVLFVMGATACGGGLYTTLAHQYQATLRSLSAQAALLGNRVSTDTTIEPILDSITNLLQAVSQLIKTAVGIGVFLCLAGVAMCLTAFWMLGQLN